MAEDKVKISIRFKLRRDLPAGESLWAEAVETNGGGGTFVLQNNAFHAALAVGDLVRAELNGDSVLQVVDIVQPAPVLLTAFAVLVDSAEARAMGDRWREMGANWSEGTAGLLMTVWEPGVDVEAVAAAFRPDLLAGRGHWRSTARPEDRTREAQTVVDFELDRVEHFPPVETTYWAPDDPYWREQGLASPDFLAYVQSLAGCDQQIASALEIGDHDKVLEIIAWINGGEAV